MTPHTRALAWAILCAIALFACGDDSSPAEPDGDADSDADSDTDADSDSDGDTDADSDADLVVDPPSYTVVPDLQPVFDLVIAEDPRQQMMLRDRTHAIDEPVVPENPAPGGAPPTIEPGTTATATGTALVSLTTDTAAAANERMPCDDDLAGDVVALCGDDPTLTPGLYVLSWLATVEPIIDSVDGRDLLLAAMYDRNGVDEAAALRNEGAWDLLLDETGFDDRIDLTLAVEWSSGSAPVVTLTDTRDGGAVALQAPVRIVIAGTAIAFLLPRSLFDTAGAPAGARLAAIVHEGGIADGDPWSAALEPDVGSLIGFDASVPTLHAFPPSISLPIGAQMPLHVEGHVGDQVFDVTDAVTFGGGLLIVNDVGMAVAPDLGEGVLGGEFDGSEVSIDVSVTDTTINDIWVQPALSSGNDRGGVIALGGLNEGIQWELRAGALYADGRRFEVTESAEWTSGDEDVVTVSNEDGTRGHVTGVAAGTTNIMVEIGGIQATRDVVVFDGTPSEPMVSPNDNPLNVAPGIIMPLIVTTDFEDPLTGAAFTLLVNDLGTWSSSSESAQVTASGPYVGTVSGVSPGQALLSEALPWAIPGGFEVFVGDWEMDTIDIVAPDVLHPGDVAEFRVIASLYDIDGIRNTLQDATHVAQWTTNQNVRLPSICSYPSVTEALAQARPGVGYVDATDLTEGEVTVTARVHGLTTEKTIPIEPRPCDLAGDCPSPNGTPCQGPAECTSESCVDGVCCDRACDGTCETCDATGSVGACTFVAAGISDETCNQFGERQCDGAGTCKSATGQACVGGDGTTCVSGFCVDNNCCENACAGACMRCNTEGLCQFSDVNTSDPPLCPFPARCNATGFCRVSNGTPCQSGDECQTGWCPPQDGVCCDYQCEGDCESCLASKSRAGVDGVCDAIQQDEDFDNECPDPWTCQDEGLPPYSARCEAHLGDPCVDAAWNSDCPDAGFCRSGFCCDQSNCGEGSFSLCHSCAEADTGFPNGECAPVLQGRDPLDECTDPANPVCNGAGGCGPP